MRRMHWKHMEQGGVLAMWGTTWHVGGVVTKAFSPCPFTSRGPRRAAMAQEAQGCTPLAVEKAQVCSSSGTHLPPGPGLCRSDGQVALARHQQLRARAATAQVHWGCLRAGIA